MLPITQPPTNKQPLIDFYSKFWEQKPKVPSSKRNVDEREFFWRSLLPHIKVKMFSRQKTERCQKVWAQKSIDKVHFYKKIHKHLGGGKNLHELPLVSALFQWGNFCKFFASTKFMVFSYKKWILIYGLTYTKYRRLTIPNFGKPMHVNDYTKTRIQIIPGRLFWQKRLVSHWIYTFFGQKLLIKDGK